jgi:hypothetical protein
MVGVVGTADVLLVEAVDLDDENVEVVDGVALAVEGAGEGAAVVVPGAAAAAWTSVLVAPKD